MPPSPKDIELHETDHWLVRQEDHVKAEIVITLRIVIDAANDDHLRVRSEAAADCVQTHTEQLPFVSSSKVTIAVGKKVTDGRLGS